MTKDGVSPAIDSISFTAIHVVCIFPGPHKHVVAVPDRPPAIPSYSRTIRRLPSALTDAAHVAAATASVVGVHARGDPADAARVLGRRLGHPADGRVVPRERGGHGVVVCGAGGVSRGAGGAEDEAGGGGCGCADRLRPTLHQRLLHPQLHPPPSQPAHRRRRDRQDNRNLHNRLRRNARHHRLHGASAPSALPHLQARAHLLRKHLRLDPPHQHPRSPSAVHKHQHHHHTPSLTPNPSPAAARRRANPPPRPRPPMRLRSTDARAAVHPAARGCAASPGTAVGRIPNHPSRHRRVLAPPAGGGSGVLHHLLRHATTPRAQRAHLHALPLPPRQGPAHPTPRADHLPAHAPPANPPLPHRAPAARSNAQNLLHLHALPHPLPQPPPPAARRRRHLRLPPRRVHRLPRPPHVRPARNPTHPPPQHPPPQHHPRRRNPLRLPHALPSSWPRAHPLAGLRRAQPHARAGAAGRGEPGRRRELGGCAVHHEWDCGRARGRRGVTGCRREEGGLCDEGGGDGGEWGGDCDGGVGGGRGCEGGGVGRGGDGGVWGGGGGVDGCAGCCGGVEGLGGAVD